mgnify:CR=1 FL=1
MTPIGREGLPAAELAAPVLAHWVEAGDSARHPGGGFTPESGCSPWPETYRVKLGDTLDTIAEEFGIPVDSIKKANDFLKNTDRVEPGQRLTIPIRPLTKGDKEQAFDIQYNSSALAGVSKSVTNLAKNRINPKDQQARDTIASNIPIILKHCAERGIRDSNQVAYILATADHESRFGVGLYSRSESLVEDNNRYIRGRKPTHLSMMMGDENWSVTPPGKEEPITAQSSSELEIKYWNEKYGPQVQPGLGNRPGTTDARDFRGRGFVQLTGRSNYQKMSDLLNAQGFSYTLDGVVYGGVCNKPIDLLTNFEHVNRSPELSARIMVSGMHDGSFRPGHTLDRYIEENKVPDFPEARKIINTDEKTKGPEIAQAAWSYAWVLTDWPAVFVLE